MRRTRVTVTAAISAIVLLAGCSSGNDSAPTTTTSAPAPATATAPPTTTPSTTGSTTANDVRIVTLTGPQSPPTCNAPTSVELRFETKNATSVTLEINGGGEFATYSSGAHDELVPLACDGSPQTYRLTARGANGATVSKTLTIEPRMLAVS